MQQQYSVSDSRFIIPTSANICSDYEEASCSSQTVAIFKLLLSLLMVIRQHLPDQSGNRARHLPLLSHLLAVASKGTKRLI